MKWFFCLSGGTLDRADHNWISMATVAVKSCLKNTQMEPHLLYDGDENDFTLQMRALGVKIIKHTTILYDDLAKLIADKKSLDIACGAFLRYDIPLYCKDRVYLYTDVDVIFLSPIDLDVSKINNFMAAPQFSKTDYENDLNSGVLLVNNQQMRHGFFNFIDYARESIHETLFDYDQRIIRNYFKNNYSYLPIEYNWKPYWGICDAKIVHFHGPKPLAIKHRLESNQKFDVQAWEDIFQSSPESYKHYLSLFEKFL